MKLKLQSNVLKLCLFATGLSGIVAEYVLSTLATYFLGNSVFQWTIIVSIMLFAMGLGSRVSKYIEHGLLRKFILLEFILSLLTAFSSILTHLASILPEITSLAIYTLSIIVGLLIGMEIPLVIRINNQFEELKVNVSSILENDYYGSLIGGMFFAFIGLPYFGLTYTPFILGGVNFSVALVLLYTLWKNLSPSLKKQLWATTSFIAMVLMVGSLLAYRITDYCEKIRYKDRVILNEQSQYQKVVITQNDTDYWLYINGNQQLSTVDEWEYHEPLVHPAMLLVPQAKNVLILGGGDGCAAREVLKHKSVESITVVDLDPLMTDLAQFNEILSNINQGAFNDKKIHIINADGFNFIENTKDYFDVIIVDLPDPKSVELSRLYSLEFYGLCYKRLRATGAIVTQAGSPYFAPIAYECINKTMQEAGFATSKYHNHVLTLGEWGWVIGLKTLVPDIKLKPILQQIDPNPLNLKILNKESLIRMSSFGKGYFYKTSGIETNTVQNPVLLKYYRNGRWDLY